MKRDLVLVSASLFAWGMGEGMFIYFQPLYLQQWGANPLEIGIILGWVGVAMTVAHLPAGYISDRWGQRPVMWFSWILGTLAAGIMSLAGSLSMFVVGMLIYGLTSFVSAPLNSYVASAGGKLGVGRSLTIIQIFYNFGAVLGPTIGGLIAQQYSIAAIYRWSFLLFGLSTLIIFFIRRQSAPVVHHATEPAAPILRNRRFLWLLPFVLLTTFALYLPQPLTPNFLQNQRHLTDLQIGQLGSLGSLGTALVVLAFGSLSPALGLAAGQVFVGLYAFLLWQGNLPVIYAAAFFFIGGYRLARSLILAFTRSLIDPRSTGIAFGIVEMVNGLAVFAAPLLAGILYAHDPASVYTVAVIFIALTLILNLVGLPHLTRAAGAIPRPSPAHPE